MRVSKPPNEKVCEELFLAYTLQYARSGKLVMYAPSQREEYLAGYDAALFTGNCRELILQFKRLHCDGRGLYFNIAEGSTHQRDLLQAYPDHSAFYVVGSFENPSDLFDAQSNQLTAAGFLDRYITVPAHVLVDGMRVYVTKRRNYARSFYLNRSGIEQELGPYERFTGSELLRRFLQTDRFEAGAVLSVDESSNTVRVLPNPGTVNTDFQRLLSPEQGMLSDSASNEDQSVSMVFIRYCA